jgi:hypothetical protein
MLVALLQSGEVVAACRGSDSTDDWITNFKMARIAVKTPYASPSVFSSDPKKEWKVCCVAPVLTMSFSCMDG